jgi:NADH-quinone oxidoreductase subunit L
MTVPLMVLAALAAVAGFLDAAPIHVDPLGKLLEPVFAKASLSLAERPGIEKLEVPLMGPGVLAFVLGGGLAFVFYLQRGGAPEKSFAASFPRLYQLVYDKWRIDELYDATVVGMVDALADIFTMADTWLIDGILAKVSAALVAFAGTVLRSLQTGRVQAYSASMVIGLAGLGWFLVRPHAAVSVDDKAVKTSGVVTISAAPGLGYHYAWAVKDAGSAPKPPDGAKPDARELTVTLNPGESKEVTLEVTNAFNSKSLEVIPLSRPNRSGTAPAPAQRGQR